MKHLRKALAGIFIVGLIWANPGFAATPAPRIVAACPSATAIFTNGQVGTPGAGTVDLFGNTCGSSSGGGATSPIVGAANFTPGQATITNAATIIAAARIGTSGVGRISITVVQTGTTPIYLGGSGVTTSTGTLLPGVLGASVTIGTTAAVYGITASGSQLVTEFETY